MRVEKILISSSLIMMEWIYQFFGGLISGNIYSSLFFSKPSGNLPIEEKGLEQNRR